MVENLTAQQIRQTQGNLEYCRECGAIHRPGCNECKFCGSKDLVEWSNEMETAFTIWMDEAPTTTYYVFSSDD